MATVAPSAADSPEEALTDLVRKVERLREGQAKLEKELREVKDLLRARAATRRAAPPPDLILSLDGRIVKGAATATVVIVDFTDYQCPFCAQYVRETLPLIEQEYIDTGKVRYTVREFPLEHLHPHAFKAAQAALCAGEQGRYWEMHHKLFADARALDPHQLLAHARGVGIDETAFTACFETDRTADRVRGDIAEGQKAGITGMPSFFVGLVDETGKVVKVVRAIPGAQPYANFKATIDAVLTGVK